MPRKFLAFLLCLALTLSPALAVGGSGTEEQPAAYAASASLFPKVNSYAGFPDVKADHWAYSAVRVCYETGLMEGQGTGFAPSARITNAEVAMLAARIHAALTGGSFDTATEPWYKGAVSYLNALGITTGSHKAFATRQSFFSLLSAVLPDSTLTPINSISLLPDTGDATVLKFYNAGILTGVDKYGTFNGSGVLTRAECAAMVARIVEPSLRQRFTPAGQVPAAPFEDSAVVITVNGSPVGFGHFLDTMLSLIEETQALYLNYGLVFSWDGSYGMESWPQFFKEATTHSLAAELLATQKAEELGCTLEELALTLFGSPTRETLNAYAAEQGLTPRDQDDYDLLAEMFLEEKLNEAMGQWVAAAEVATTPIYDQLDPQELWELYG